MPSHFQCPQAGCNYPEGECSGACSKTVAYDPDYDPAVDAAARGLLSASCLAPSQLAALRRGKGISELAADPAMRAFWSDGTHGLPIDLVEPCPARVEGDRVPCHLFMPDVAWLAPLGPVLRTPRRHTWLQRPVRPWSPIEPSADTLEPPGFGRVVAAIGIVWVCAAAGSLVARMLGAL